MFPVLVLGKCCFGDCLAMVMFVFPFYYQLNDAIDGVSIVGITGKCSSMRLVLPWLL